MNPDFEKFIRETPKDDEKDKLWKFRLLGAPLSTSLALDTLYIGSQSIADIIKNHVTDKEIDPKIIEAYRLQYPGLSQHHQFVDEVRKFAHDSEGLRGLLGGVKGKLFEIDCVNYLNIDGHLPQGLHAELSAKANEPGVDIWIKDAHGHVNQEIQAKAMESLQGVREHLERYPEIQTVFVPSDQISQEDLAGLSHNVTDVHVTNGELEAQVTNAADHSGYADHFHFPFVGFAFMAGEVTYLMYRGKPINAEKFFHRGIKIVVAGGVSTVVFSLCHSFWVSIPVAVVTRIALDRYRETNEFLKDLERIREWSVKWRKLGNPTPVTQDVL